MSETEQAPDSKLGVTQDGIWALAWPTMAAMGAGTVVRFTDFAMVGSLGPEALAGVGLGGQFYWLLESVVAVAPGGLAAILARAVGAGDGAAADASLRQAQILGVLLALASSLLLFPFTTQAISIYGVEREVVGLGADYLWWRIWGTIPLSIVMVFGAGLRAAGDVKTPLWIMLFSSAGNVFFNWVLIYGNLGAPALGVVGAAIASNLALLLMMLPFIGLWAGHRLVLKPSGGGWRPDLDLFRRLMRIGTPAGLESGFFQMGLLLFQRIMSAYGTNVIAAYNIGTTVLSCSFIPGVGFSMAAATLVGQHLGAEEPERARQAGWRGTALAVAAMSVFGLVLVLCSGPLGRLFTEDPEVLELTRTIILILAVAHPFMAVEFALGGALRGAGDTLFPMLTVFAGLMVVRLGVASLLVTYFDASIEMVWSVLILDYVLKTALFVGRFRGGSWQRRSV
ncbi:MAG: MATE family efflux transporter [Myxococcota bacterium]